MPWVHTFSHYILLPFHPSEDFIIRSRAGGMWRPAGLVVAFARPALEPNASPMNYVVFGRRATP